MKKTRAVIRIKRGDISHHIDLDISGCDINQAFEKIRDASAPLINLDAQSCVFESIFFYTEEMIK